MTNTPYSHLTANELSQEIANKKEPTDMEIAAMQRIDELLDKIEDLQSDIEELEQYRSKHLAAAFAVGVN